MNEQIAQLALAVVQAARVWGKDPYEQGVDKALIRAVDTLEEALTEQQWKPGTFADMRPNYRVRLGDVEALVVDAHFVTPKDWIGRGYQPGYMSFTLRFSDGRDKTYQKKANNVVEIMRPLVSSSDPEFQDAVDMIAHVFDGVEIL